jgi:hypothetical protein
MKPSSLAPAARYRLLRSRAAASPPGRARPGLRARPLPPTSPFEGAGANRGGEGEEVNRRAKARSGASASSGACWRRTNKPMLPKTATMRSSTLWEGGEEASRAHQPTTLSLDRIIGR